MAKFSQSSIKNILYKIPKVELHLHLEGSIPLNTLFLLIEKYNKISEIGNFQNLKNKFQYKDFGEFIETWVWKNQFIREYEDFTFIASSVAKKLVEQNIVYVEAFFSPGDFVEQGLDIQKITEAIRKGLDVYKDQVTVNLIADLIRDFGPAKGRIWLEQLAEVKELGIIGIGLGGSEKMFPPQPYEPIYKRAKELGFRKTAHAGETSGAKSIWGAIRSLEVERIGHGIRAIEDSELLCVLKHNQIPLEICPTSNIKTKIITHLEEHPLKILYQQGLMITINTDDPTMFNTNLVNEYYLLIEKLGFEIKDILKLLHNSIYSAWCNTETKELLFNQLNQYFDQYQFVL
jgi:adenosine deaminase